MATIRRAAQVTAGATVALMLASTATAWANTGSPASQHPTHAIFKRHHDKRLLARFGTVSAVNGSSTPGTCGVADTAGAFTLTHKTITQTVDVSATTPVYDRATTTPSFADVCVGDPAGAIGSVSGTTLEASAVFVPTPKSTTPHGLGPQVTSLGVPKGPKPTIHDLHHDNDGPSSRFGHDHGVFGPSSSLGDGPSDTHGWTGAGRPAAGEHDSSHTFR